MLRAFCDSEGIPCTALAIRHTVLAPGIARCEGILVRSLWSFSTPRNLGLAHSVFIMTNV